MTTADKIKTARKASGITQKELGERMGVSDASITQYESGKRNPKMATIKRIAEALNVSEMDIMGDDEIIAINKVLNDISQFSADVLKKHEINKRRSSQIIDTISEDDPILFGKLVDMLDGATIDEIYDIVEIGKAYRSFSGKKIKSVNFEFEDESPGDSE